MTRADVWISTERCRNSASTEEVSMHRFLLVAVLALAGAAAAALPAGAVRTGGWAVTTIDPIAAAPVAGRPIRITFTVRQHGVRPVNVAAAIEIVAHDGAETAFSGRPLALPGRYAALVTFPQAGSWRWRVLQGLFGPQGLGSITVRRPGQSPTPALDGRSLFRAKGCVGCHVGPDVASLTGMGPRLDAFAERMAGAAGRAYIRQSIREPSAVIVPNANGWAMPVLALSDAEIDRLTRFILGQPD
jgi:cytochrome c551/c552